MATKVPTLHHSSNFPTSSTKSSASGVQPQNTPDTRLSPDQVVDRMLTKAKSPLTEGDVRTVVETLEKILELSRPMNLRTRRRCFRGLVKICGQYGILPSSHIIPESKVQRLGDHAVISSDVSAVWPGVYMECEDGSNEENTKFVAIKVMRCLESANIQPIKKNFCREVITWKRLSHPNVLKLIGATMDGREFSTVSPWMDNEDIIKFLRENPEANPLRLLEDAAHGLQYLHSVDLAHGDLKGGNILISDDGHACLADIGLTRVAGDLNSATAASQTSTTNGASTVRWCPPELLDPERFGSKKGSGPTKKSDIYSMAMTIYEVLTDRNPFHEYSDLTAMLHIIQGARPKKPIFAATRGYTQELWNMTSSCWDMDASKRPTVDHVLDALAVAAERWKPPQDDWSSSASEDEADSHTASEPEDGPVDNTSDSPGPLQSPVTETPIPDPSLILR